MSALKQLYGRSLGLLTDLYQLTMAQGYWKLGMSEHEAVFHLFFRRAPFKGGYALAAGLDLAIDLCEGLRFAADELEYLGGLRGNDGRPLFEAGFLEYLGALRFSCDVDAMPEGTAAFAHEPLLRIRGPLLQCQLLETSLLNVINFSTLIATKAARIASVAGESTLLEFGLRRAQGIDGAITAARAAVIGGCAATSNCLAGMLYQIPVRGTHAHSWVMAFESELAAFSAYAEVMPNNCVFLVDTYETIAGVGHAVTVGQRLKARGHTMIGVRLDSGDLEALSFEARRLLDEGGLEEAVVVASNDLDERSIAALTAKRAPIGVYGVGTKLATAYDQPALGGVYKLAAIRGPGEAWSYRLKRSEEAIKISNPGIQQVFRRVDAEGRFFSEDIIYDEALGSAEALTDGEALLVPIFRGGARLYESPPVLAIQARAKAQLGRLRDGLRRLDPDDVYAVRLDARLAALKAALLEEVGG
ncbi:MAG: nicotinate phosphoribosyltransferase [Nannocystis sp.]|nr:nicotinate phosphoribosyltransferase [Nannocystis sp.]